MIVGSRLRQNAAVTFLVMGSAFCSTQTVEAGAAPMSACATQPGDKGKSRQRFEATPLMAVAGELEAQGEANFHLQYSVPAAECLVESFSSSDATVTASYNSWEKDLSTLYYQFSVERPSGKSEVLVLYSGIASLLAGSGTVFHVSEEKEGVISWYAMYREAPGYTAVKALVEQIVGGTAKPLLAVRWPKGAKEGQIVAFDSKRLK